MFRDLPPLILLLCWTPAAFAEVEVYPGPDGIEPSDRYAVTVIQDGRRYPAFVYKSTSHFHADRRGSTTSWTTFSFAGPITVEVTKLDGDVRSCLARPSRFGVAPATDGDKAVLTLDRPRKLSIEFDGDVTHSMLLFADALETDRPSPGDSNVLYFGPGQHDVGIGRQVGANATVYLAGGSYVWGSFDVVGDGVTIRGRGVLSGGKWRKYNEPGNPDSGKLHDFKMIHARRVKDCIYEGVTIVDFPSFAVIGGRGATIRNLKAIGWYYNCDGLDVSENCLIEDCFLKVNDDALKLYWSNATVRDVTIWQYKNGAPFQWNWHGMSPQNVRVSDCDVIHVEYDYDANNRAVFNAAQKTGGHHRGFVFENVTIEEPNVFRLFKFDMTGDAKVTDTTFRNLKLAGPPRHENQMSGQIEFRFEGAAVAGNPVRDAASLGFKPEDAPMVEFD
jgi:hypothetical protein